jgi:hypothetical protein
MAICRILDCKVVAEDVIMCHRIGIDSRRKNENQVLALIDTIDVLKTAIFRAINPAVRGHVTFCREKRGRVLQSVLLVVNLRDGVLE